MLFIEILLILKILLLCIEILLLLKFCCYLLRFSCFVLRLLRITPFILQNFDKWYAAEKNHKNVSNFILNYLKCFKCVMIKNASNFILNHQQCFKFHLKSFEMLQRPLKLILNASNSYLIHIIFIGYIHFICINKQINKNKLNTNEHLIICT